MQYRSKLAELTMADLERLFRIQTCLDRVDDAIAATSVQAKPVIQALLRDAYFEAGAVMRKGALQALKLGRAGAYQRKHLSSELVQRLIELAELPAADVGAAGEGEAAAVAQDAGELGIASEAAPAVDSSSNPT